MPKVRFTKQDLLATTELEGNWYVLIVKEVSDWTPSKNDPNFNNIIIDFVVEGPKNVGVPVRAWFSEKDRGIAMLAKFLGCFAKIDEDKDYDPVDTKGRKVDGYIAWNPDMKMNSINEFRAHKGA